MTPIAGYTSLGATVFLLGSLAKTTIFKVPDVYIGIISNLFTGRLESKLGDGGFSVPIREPCKEGLHLKKPWESVTLISTEVQTKTIDHREFPVKGGTVFVSGTIQYRVSATAGYRYLEVDQETINAGLNSELEQILRLSLAELTVDEAITKSGTVSASLEQRLKTTDIRTTEEIYIAKGELDKDPKERTLFRKEISYAEHSYGIEIIKAKVETIDPDPKLKEERDKIQSELYQTQSQKTEFDHLMERANELGVVLPDLNDKEKLAFIKLWQKMSTEDVRKIEVEGADGLTGSLAAFLSGFGKGGNN